MSTIIGSRPYEFFAEEYQRPVVISGFEPLDVLRSIQMLVRQLNEGRAEVENEFTRGVTREGNRKAQALVAEVFELRPEFEWRGLGNVPYSGLRIKQAYAEFDAERRFGLVQQPVRENKACQCPAIIRGVKKPTDCSHLRHTCARRAIPSARAWCPRKVPAPPITVTASAAHSRPKHGPKPSAVFDEP